MQDRAGECKAGQGRAGWGRAGQGRGRAGQGRIWVVQGVAEQSVGREGQGQRSARNGQGRKGAEQGQHQGRAPSTPQSFFFFFFFFAFRLSSKGHVQCSQKTVRKCQTLLQGGCTTDITTGNS